MKLFDKLKKRKYYDLYGDNGIDTVKIYKSKKNEIKFVESIVEENDGHIQLLGAKKGKIYLISNVGKKDIKYKKSYIRHIDLFEKERVGNLYSGLDFSNNLAKISGSLSKEFENGMPEEDILFSKEIMQQLLVSSYEIMIDDHGLIRGFTIYLPTDIEDIINYECSDKRVEKAVRNIGKKLSEMSEEERFILYINYLETIFETEDEKTTDIVKNAINELLENKFNGKQPESKISIKQKEIQEKEDKINFINLSVKEKYKVKREIEENSDFHNSDITYLISLKTGDKICLSTFPIKDVDYKYRSNIINLLDDMFNEEQQEFFRNPYSITKKDFLLCSLLDINTLIKMAEYAIEWLYQPDFENYYPNKTKGYYSKGVIDEKVLNKYNELVEELNKINNRESYIEFYTKYMNKLIDHIIEKYGIDDEYQLHLLDQFIGKSMAEIIEKSNEIPYTSIRKLRTYTIDELKDLFYKRKKEPKMKKLKAKLDSSGKITKKEKDEKREIIRKQKEERIKDKIEDISNLISKLTYCKRHMTTDDIKTEILKYDSKFTVEEVELCTGLVLEKSAQILNFTTDKKLKLTRGRI